jgi:hypothetical protein
LNAVGHTLIIFYTIKPKLYGDSIFSFSLNFIF